MLPTNPMDLRRQKMKAEIDLMESEAMKKDESPTQSVEETKEGSPPEVAETITEQPVETNPNPVQDLEYWKARCVTAENRFNTSKPKYDSNIYQLKQENLALKKDRVELSKALNQARQAVIEDKPDPLDAVFGQEQIDTLGKDTVDKLRKTLTETNDAIEANRVKAEADRLKAEEKRLKDELDAEYDVFTARVKNLVPNMEELDKDPAFIKWLGNADPVSGDLRMAILRNAEASRDVGRVAEMFNQYKPAAVEVADTISARIAPVSKEGSDPLSDTSKNTMTMAEVDKFYDDAIRGKYKGRYTEKQAMLEKIAAAGY